MSNDPIIFSPVFTGKILLKYYATKTTSGMGFQGLILINVSALKEQIQLMNILFHTGNGVVQHLNIIKSYVHDRVKCRMFMPALNPKLLSTNAQFLKSYKNKGKY